MPTMRANTLSLAAAILCLTFGSLSATAQTLRIAMTASDIPTVGGIPDNGSEGYRFTGYPIYDALINWDFTHTDKLSGLTPGLATEWHVDPQDTRKWIFTLRKDVKFHDGTNFTADAAIWNFDRIFNNKSDHFDEALSAIVRSSVYMLDHYEKIDDDHIAIWTKTPFAPFPYLMPRILFASPTQYAKVGGTWLAFMQKPIGTGPFKVTKVTQHVSIEMARNSDYWDKSRIPHIERLVLLPMPEATTRLAALRSGQVDWIEVPPPDSIPSLKAAGFQISLKPYPHIWPWTLSEADNSPFKDKRIRLALNYAIDREGLVKLLNGTAIPARGFYNPEHVSFGSPHENFTYDPAKAKALLKEAGYGPDRPVKARIMISTSGSGQMMPLPMNEFLQQNLKDVGFDIDFDVVDWGTMLVANRSQPTSTASHGVNGINNSLPFGDPTYLIRFFQGSATPPNGSNWSGYANPQVDALLAKAVETFDPDELDRILGKAHGLIVDDAAWLFVVHDLDPRALSPKVKGFEPAQSWYQDLTQLTLTK